MELFDFTRTLFEKPALWNSDINPDKKKHFFITNRMLSIGHPMQANLLQHIRINPVHSMDVWQRLLRTKFKYNKTPFWFFTKGVTKNKLEKEAKINVSEELIKEYSRVYKIDIKSVRDSLIFFRDDTVKALKEFEKIKTQK